MLKANSAFVFVGGLHRSGTSLVSRAIASHPEVSAFADTGVPEDEGQHLQSVFPPAIRFGGPGKFSFARDAHLTEHSPLATDDNAHRLYDEWRRYWDVSRPFLLEKSPPNLIRMRFLQHLFPNTYFVMLVRHPVAVALATKKWSKSSNYSLFRHWVVAHRLFEADRKHVDRVLTVKYEDFTADTARTMDTIRRFLGLQQAGETVDIIPGVNDRYFSSWAEFKATPGGRVVYWLLRARYSRLPRNYGYTL